MDANNVTIIGAGSGPGPVTSAPPPPEYPIQFADQGGRGSAGDAQPCAPPPVPVESGWYWKVWNATQQRAAAGQPGFVPLLDEVDAPPSRCGRFRGSSLRSRLTLVSARFYTALGGVLLGLGIFGIIVVGVPSAQREYEKKYTQWKVDCPEPNKDDCSGCSPIDCAPCVECASGTSIAFGSVMLIAGIAIFIALLYAHIRKVDLFASV